MKFKNLLFISIVLTPLTLAANNSLHEPQSILMRHILNKENSIYHSKNLISILNDIDDTYKDLYAQVKQGKKIKIYFYPAHGKLPDGSWQGGAISQRLSCTNKPEEFYSIPIARELYTLFTNSQYFEILAPPDYLEVLKGKSEEYKHAPSVETIHDARKKGAFLMLSEHLNNVAKTRKADGLVQLQGIHISKDDYGRRYLIESNNIYAGFLTIYNKFDASGLSMEYAKILKTKLVSRGMRANGWQYGTVGFDRFYYFSAFPLSIIYESGFISNPVEEKNLRDPEKIKIIAKAQYDACIDLLATYFGLRISGDKLANRKVYNQHRIELLKLTRIAAYYIRKTDTAKALFIIRLMEQKYWNTGFRKYISYYHDVKSRIATAEHYYTMGKKYAHKKKYKAAKRYFWKARGCIKTTDFYSAYITKYYNAIYGEKKPSNLPIAVKASNPKTTITPKDTGKIEKTIPNDYEHIGLINTKKAPLSRPIILTREKGQSVRDAIKHALDPDIKILNKLEQKFKRAHIVSYSQHAHYSKKRKRWIWNKRKNVRRVWFGNGIYIVKLNKHLEIIDAQKVSIVRLIQWKYQNQQYLKNSHFSSVKKEKNI